MSGTAYLGYYRGALAELSQMGALVLGLILSVWLSGGLVKIVVQFLPGSPHVATGVLFGVLFMVFYIFLRLVFRVVEYLADSQPRWIDHWGGVLVGIVKGALIITVALAILDNSSGRRWIQIFRRESVIIDTLYTFQKKAVQTLDLHFPIPEKPQSLGMEI